MENVRPGGDARTGTHDGHRRRGEQPVVPPAEFTSYYGMPVLNVPVWKNPDVPAYLFLGGLSGASALLAAGAHATRRPQLSTSAKVIATGSIALSAAALIHDLGRPARFFKMLRVFKVSSPLSVGSWLLAAYGPMTGVSAMTAVTARCRRLGVAATAAAAVLGPAVATYTGAVVSNTAVPAWHDAFREMPFVFAGSSATAAGGAGLLAAPVAQAAPARRVAIFGAALETVASRSMKRRLGPVGEPYQQGRAGAAIRTGQLLTAAGLTLAFLGRRRRALNALAGVSLMGASALTRFGIFEAGKQSAADPRYTVQPQRERLDGRPDPDAAHRSP